jgi:zinc protease
MNTIERAYEGEIAMRTSNRSPRTRPRIRLLAGAALAFAALVAADAIPAAAQGGPQGGGKGTAMSKVERLNRAPVNKEVLRVQLPKPVTAKLANGLTVVMLEDHKLPTIAFTMMIRPGQLADPADLPGLASFTADMLTEGTAKRTSEQIANEVASIGASLNAGSRFGSSFSSVNASGLINDTPQILDLMSDVVLHPAFPDSELAKYKQRAQSDLDQQLSNPGFLAQQAFRRVLYGDAPLGVASATKESVEKVTVADLKKFHGDHFRPGNTILGVTGDFHADEMKAMIEKYFGAWSGAAEPPVKLAAMPKPEAAKITLVDRPNSVQTNFVAGDRGVRRSDPEYYALTVMNQVEGGGPQSRLFLDLREEHSLTYGAFSRTDADIYVGDWQASSPVRTKVTGDAMERFTYEFKKISNEPVGDSELDEARRTIVAGFALSLERPAQLLSYFLTVEYYGLSKDYWDKYPDHIAAVDAAAVQAAAKKYIDLDHMQWIAVGDRKQIQDALAKYGPVSVVDVNGKPEN